jgi:hypothetical protein
MAYMRGKYYIWSDGHEEYCGVHFWSATGYDYWNEMGWHVVENDVVVPEHLDEKGEVTASGVYLENHIVDKFTIMRLVEMIHEGRLEGAVNDLLAEYAGEEYLPHYVEGLDGISDVLKVLYKKKPGG